MDLLTDKEIDAVAETYPYNISLYTRAIEAAVINKLAGVSVKPVAWRFELATTKCNDDGYGGWTERLSNFEPNVPDGSIRNLTPLYTAEALAAARVQENERCVAVVRDVYDKTGFTTCDVGADCIEAIRALLGATK